MVWSGYISGAAWNHATKNQEKIIKNSSNNVQVNKFGVHPKEISLFSIAIVLDLELISCGGLLINDAGDFMTGFACNLGVSLVLQTELWVIFHDIQLAREQHILQVGCQSNSTKAIHLILDGCNERSCLVSDLLNYKEQHWASNGGVFQAYFQRM